MTHTKKRKVKKAKTYPKKLPLDMEKHIRTLGFSSPKEYRDWCRWEYLSPSLEKSPEEREKEVERMTLRTQRIESRRKMYQRLRETGKRHNLRKLIQRIHAREVKSDELATPALKEIHSAVRKGKTSKVLLEALLHLESVSKLLEDPSHVKGVAALTQYFPQWIRPIQEWEPKSHNADRQLSSLARHLLARYEVPVFMDSAWMLGKSKEQKWFIHIGSGKNIRTAEGLPVSLTKKMAHHFLQAPDTYTIGAAFRWGQVHTLGGTRRLADAFLETRLVRDLRDNGFALSLIRWFIKYPMLDRAHVAPIVDYIWNQKYENRQVFVRRGVAEEADPPQPNFAMKGRTPETMLGQVERWHRQLGKEAKGGNLQWTRSGIGEFEFMEGKRESKNMKLWTIRELLSSQELTAEGRAMKHCVASYAHSCARKKSSIWTLGVDVGEGHKKLLTIELSNAGRQIQQLRGKNNRLPNPKEKGIINRWTTKENLQLASYLQ